MKGLDMAIRNPMKLFDPERIRIFFFILRKIFKNNAKSAIC